MFLKHYGTKRHSGRYPWGSGKNPQRSKDFLSYVNTLRSKGMSETDIAKSMNMTTSVYRARITSENTVMKLNTINDVMKFREKGYSIKAIADRMHLSEKTVEKYLKPSTEAKLQARTATVDALRDLVGTKKMIDVGVSSEQQLGVSSTRLKAALEQLKQEGYVVHTISVDQLGQPGQQTNIKVLAPPGTTQGEIYKNRYEIKPIVEIHSSDNGQTWDKRRDVELVNPKRIEVRYGSEGGSDRDGLIELRRGVKDLDLGNNSYSQVRIAVEGNKYLKGMAVYTDDLPDGVDIRFNTNKSRTDSKLDAMKNFEKDIDGKIDLQNPFGSTIKVGGQRGALNVVNDEGDWDDWGSKNTLSSQFLSKQSTDLAKRQLDLAYNIRKDDYDEIVSLTNPTIKKELLGSYADKMESDAVFLKAAALPRQATKVILPVTELKENEVYTTSYKNGERLVLIRYPHGGKFEIPEVVVNNKNPKAIDMIGQSVDAIGIHPSVAKKLSGADFDGDSVIVIPNKKGTTSEIKTSPTIKELQEFDPQQRYAVPKELLYDAQTNPGGFKPMTKKMKGIEMGMVTNLITDMTIKGATEEEIVRAVKHSMTIIDSEKHKLNYKQSAIDHNISELTLRYQGKKRGGASTLVSRASAMVYVEDRTNYATDKNGKRVYIDPVTGDKLSTPTGKTTTQRVRDSKGNWTTKEVPKKVKSTRMMETNDATTLSSGTAMEKIYADYANNLKNLARQARLEMLRTPNLEYSPSAAKTYATEVASLNAKLKLATGNKTYERQAQLVGDYLYTTKKKSNPELDSDDLKKLRGQSLAIARERVGAKKKQIEITDNEWKAIQSGAISDSKLTQILANTNKDDLIRRSLPKSTPILSSGKIARARSMMARGYSQADVAEMLGVSVSTLNKALK